MKSYNQTILDTYEESPLDNRPTRNRFVHLRMSLMLRWMAPRRQRAARIVCPALAGLLASVAMLGVGCVEPEERPASWSYVHTAVLRPACSTSSCHSTASSAGGIDLSTPATAYSYLLGRPCSAPSHPEDAPGNYVFPFQPGRSRLLALLRGTPTVIMPPDTPLPASEIALVERWILEGASCD